MQRTDQLNDLPVGYSGPYASVANDEAHVLDAGIDGRLVEIGQFEVVDEMAGEFCATTHFPQDQAKGVHVGAFERFELSHVQSVIQHLRSHVPMGKETCRD